LLKRRKKDVDARDKRGHDGEPGDPMKRRHFITLAGSAAVAWPLALRAQQAERMRRVGVLFGTLESDPKSPRYSAVFRQELAKRGWTEGRNLHIDFRFSAEPAATEASAAELVRLAPDVIYAWGGIQVRAVQQQTQTIPIVFIGPSSQVADVNVARPQGNITGFPFLYPSIAGKWVELLKEADPRVSRVAAIYSGVLGGNTSYFPFVREAAASLAIGITTISLASEAEFERGIDAFALEPNGGLVVLPGSVTGTPENKSLLRELVAKYRLPVVHWDNTYPAEGGLMSYASNFEDLHRRAAGYVDRLLRGAKVNELPIERPTRFELIINLKAAKAIDLTLPPLLVTRADQVIE
jgi:putative ABC transport system substrate-binding protein